jgi:hypothetical protein
LDQITSLLDKPAQNATSELPMDAGFGWNGNLRRCLIKPLFRALQFQ